MKAFSFVKSQVSHGEIDTHDGDDFDHLVGNQVQKARAPLTLDVSQRYHSDLLRLIFVKEGQLEATTNIDLEIVIV